MIGIEYKTKPGDNKQWIMKKMAIPNFSIDRLKLEPNQLLHLPIRTDEGLVLKEYYTTESDTLQHILQKHKLDMNTVAYFNLLDTLYVVGGQTVPLPSDEKGEMAFTDNPYECLISPLNKKD